MTNEEQATVAAKWWRDRLGERAKLDNGDPSPQGGMTFMMASMLQPDIPSEQTLDTFEATLREAVLAALNESISHVCLSCDYGPNDMLAESAQKAEILAASPPFPWKTNMNCFKGKVSVSHGYGAEYVELDPPREG